MSAKGPSSTLIEALTMQGRVIQALIMREMKTRFGRQRLGYAWALIEPLIYVAIFMALYSFRGREAPSGIPILPFLVTGVMPFMLFRNMVTRTLGALLSNRALLYFPQVTPFDLVVARALLEIGTAAFVFAIFMVAAQLSDQSLRVERPLDVVVWFAVGSLVGFGLGTIFSTLGPLFASIERLVPTVLLRPLFFTSGLFFTAEMIPAGVRDFALLNPMLHVTELVRSALFVGFESEYADPAYPIQTALVLTFIGLTMQRAMRKRVLTALQG
ncbi:MAG: ABC transporter permease [Ectothiorhodospiraceae bacterium]|nr:ABC transporter permease [Ectothiorhodospiraceae bacterium]